jgi:hypothetical protein
MGQSDGDPLKKLDAFIKEQSEAYQPRQPGEFTLQDYIEKMKANGIKISISNSARTMNELIESGKMKMRKSLEKGRLQRLYRFL